MRFDIITTFPRIFDSYLSESILKRARKRRIFAVKVHDLRTHAGDPHRKVDDRPYGGGAGMVLKAGPLLRAAAAVERSTRRMRRKKVVVFSAKGKPFTQSLARRLARSYDQITLICGRYEGIDERVRLGLRADEISVGPYILTDGEVAAMALLSAVVRLLPGAIRPGSLAEESFGTVRSGRRGEREYREYPQYTRPEVIVYGGKRFAVPRVLLSGNHAKIKAWRARHMLR